MVANKEKTQKKCCFYVSDFHLEMTILPYINKKIEDNNNIVIITENKLEETIKILISRMNIKNKNKILKLDWNNKNINLIQNEENLVIINGTKKFVDSKNKELNEYLREGIIEVVNCYMFEEIKDEIVEITAKHTEVLNNLEKTVEKK